MRSPRLRWPIPMNSSPLLFWPLSPVLHRLFTPRIPGALAEPPDLQILLAPPQRVQKPLRLAAVQGLRRGLCRRLRLLTFRARVLPLGPAFVGPSLAGPLLLLPLAVLLVGALRLVACLPLLAFVGALLVLLFALCLLRIVARLLLVLVLLLRGPARLLLLAFLLAQE